MSTTATGSLELEGDSTLHKYSVRTQVFDAVVEIPDAAHATGDLESALRGAHIESVTLTIPVNRLTSGDATLDSQLRKSLKDERFPSIRFVADSFEVTAPAGGASFGVAMRGRLEIAGAERPLDVEAQGFRTTAGVRVVGRKALLMTDFDIEPPRLMWGALKTANRVLVKFDIELHATAARP